MVLVILKVIENLPELADQDKDLQPKGYCLKALDILKETEYNKDKSVKKQGLKIETFHHLINILSFKKNNLLFISTFSFPLFLVLVLFLVLRLLFLFSYCFFYLFQV